MIGFSTPTPDPTPDRPALTESQRIVAAEFGAILALCAALEKPMIAGNDKECWAALARAFAPESWPSDLLPELEEYRAQVHEVLTKRVGSFDQAPAPTRQEVRGDVTPGGYL